MPTHSINKVTLALTAAGLMTSINAFSADCSTSIINIGNLACAMPLSGESISVLNAGSVYDNTSTGGVYLSTSATGLNIGGISVQNGGLIQYAGSTSTSGAININYTGSGAATPLDTLGGIVINGTLSSSKRAIYLNGFTANSIYIGSTGNLTSTTSSMFLTDRAGIQGDLTNYGSITSATSFGIWLQNSTIGGNIINGSTGAISGADSGGQYYSIVMQSGSASGIINSTGGVLNGAISVSGTVANGIENSGTINSSVNSGNVAIQVQAGGNVATITNNSTGVINGLIDVNTTNPLEFNNTGLVNGAIAFHDTPGLLNINGSMGAIAGIVSGTAATVNVNGIFSTQNTFDVKSFNVNPGGGLTLNNNVVVANGNLFYNKGNVTVSPQNSPTINGDYSQSGIYTLGVQSPLIYSVLNISGTANFLNSYGFGILSNSNLQINTLYRGILKSSEITGFTPQSYAQSFGGRTYKYQVIKDETNPAWLDLLITRINPTAEVTQAALQNTAFALRGVYDIAKFSINNNLDVDSNLYDENGISISLIAARTIINGTQGGKINDGIFVASKKINGNFRIGAYLDQSFGGTSANGIITSNNGSSVGAFGVWNQNTDGFGTQIRISAGQSPKELKVTRQIVETSEAGTGKTGFNSHGISLIGSYAIEAESNFVISPFVGLRRTRITANGYTEENSVSAPLTFDALTQKTITKLAGIKFSKSINEKLVTYGSVGFERDSKNENGFYSATSTEIASLTPINFNTIVNKTRPVGSIGAYYNFGRSQRLTADFIWSKQAYSFGSSKLAMLKYTVGF